MRPLQRIMHALVIFAVVFALGAVASAQTFRGGISGGIVDESGGVLPGVTVTATNTATGMSRTTVSSSTGVFTLPDLAPGTYDVSVTLESFQPQRQAVEVSVSRISTVDFKMGISTLTEVVNVSAAAVTLDMQSTALANAVQPKRCRTCR